MVTPRCICIRHGETEWSKSGQYTGATDLPLTQKGVEEMRRSGLAIFQKNNYIDPNHITYVFCSPRTRAKQTMDLIFESLSAEQKSKFKIVIDEDLREWEYGDYEGKLTKEIIELRKSRGLDTEKAWDIWRDGCENGESSEQFGLRLSRAIARIQNLHRVHQKEGITSDILIFAHGHAIRYMTALWLGFGVEKDCVTGEEKANVNSYDNVKEVPYVELTKYSHLDINPRFLLCAGGISVLSYSHDCIDEPALELSGAFLPCL